MSAIDRALDGVATDAGWQLFLALVAGSELFVLLEAEDPGGAAVPAIFDTEEGRFVLAFDSVDRLADFAGAAAYAALSGRELARQIAGHDVSLGLNIGAASETVLAPEALVWLAQDAAAMTPAEVELEEVLPPGEVSALGFMALDTRLAALAGIAARAYLARARIGCVERGLLVIVGTAAEAQSAVSEAVADFAARSGLAEDGLTVVHVGPEAPLVATLERVGLRFDLPEVSGPERRGDAPPRLR